MQFRKLRKFKSIDVFFQWLFILLMFSACQNEQQRIKPGFGSFTESVYASLNVQPVDNYQVFVNRPALIDNIYVEEGDTVYKGHILATLAHDNEERIMQSARLQLELAEKKFKGEASALSSIQAEINSVKKELELDSMNYLRQQDLWDKGIGSKVELENKKLKYELNFNRYSSLYQKYIESRLELETNYQVSINQLLSAERNLSDYTIRALMDGMVYTLSKKRGEFISTQEPFATIGKANEFILDMSVDEADIPRIKEGQLAIIALDAYPEEVFEANVSKIFPSKDTRNQTFTVEARFKKVPMTLYAGMSGEANIVINVMENSVFIPREYLTERNTVYTDEGEVKVGTGLMNMEDVQITSGLDTATWIVKQDE
ncbi:MAG: efflux RND transporter periplasmic adaptor subunit [Vicingaceae bacterium]